ncbi:MAG: hypothetical protein OJF62_001279 [Pseudolabrys sp.]|jgi:hypothetical protein|nr:hypothetical protein [Pseudolabrys sp.]
MAGLRTVDTHTHILTEETIALLNKPRDMDAASADVHVLSVTV